MTSLNERLDEIRAGAKSRFPAEAVATMQRATQELAGSDIMEGVAGVGAAAPVFARPDVDGKTVRLEGLLRNGPVVLSFFRGRW